MDYSKLSNFEINKAVAEALGFDVSYEQVNEVVGSMWVTRSGKGACNGLPDYCNSPSDAWPIIIEIWSTLMSIVSYDYGVGLGESKTTLWDARSHMYGDDKLRAAMIVYLIMKEG